MLIVWLPSNRQTLLTRLLADLQALVTLNSSVYRCQLMLVIFNTNLI